MTQPTDVTPPENSIQPVSADQSPPVNGSAELEISTPPASGIPDNSVQPTDVTPPENSIQPVSAGFVDQKLTSNTELEMSCR